MSYEFMAPLEITDFSGGITDNYIDCKPNQYQSADNFIIERNNKIISRDGTLIYNSTAYQIPPGNLRIGGLIKHAVNVELFAQAARNLYYIASSAWQTLLGPVDSNPVLSVNATTNYCSWADWHNHTFIVSDSFAAPAKIYKDQSAVYRANTAGLPRVDLMGAISMANDLRTKYAAHRVDIAQHTLGADTLHVVTAAAAFDFNSLVTLIADLLTQYTAHNADARLPAGRLYHPNQNTSALAVLDSVVSPKTIDECLTRLTDLKAKYNAHDANNSHNVLASHQSSAVYLPIITGTAGAATYIYTFIFRHLYQVNDVQFEVLGPLTQVTAANLNLAAGNNSITGIPVLTNGSTGCYDTANITVDIYRTADAGTVSYYVGRVTNGTTTYTDSLSDALLVLNNSIYTNGGELENDPPPPSKFLVVVNDQGFYLNVKEGTVNFPNRYRVSKPGNLDSAPESLFGDIEVELTGGGSINEFPIIYGRERIYRIEGTFDSTGRGAPKAVEVSKTKGCISNLGIVRIPEGHVFPGIDGFYFTDGYKVMPISTHLITTYKQIVATASQEKKIYGKYDSSQNRVYWGLQSDSGSGDSDAMFVLDLNFPLGPESVFTTFSNVNSWSPVAIEFFNGTFVIADKRGYVFKFDPNTTTDPKINVLAVPSTWNTSAIIWDFISFASSFGTTVLAKFVPSITLQAKNQTNVSIQIKSNNQDSGFFKPLKEIRYRENITWGDPNVIWDDPNFLYEWDVEPIIKALRRFPAGSLRTFYKQIEITNSYTIVYASDNFSVGTVAAAHTLTLADITLIFPTDIVDYFVSFSNDDYANQFLITTRNSATQLTFTDPNLLAPLGSSMKWQISGYRKNEQLNLLSYAIAWAPVRQNQDVFRGVTGGNA